MSLDLLRLQVSSGMVVAARHWRRICHTALTGYGISEACAAPLLMIVRLGDGVHQVAVAQAAGLESPSLVRLLDQLCKAGLVCRSEDPLDRRAKALSLTAEGRALAEAIEAELVRLRRDVLNGIDQADLEAALRVLRAFEAAGLGSAGGGGMNGFFSSVPPARDWFYGVRTFAASMIALYIALLMQLPRPYWAMATVYIVSSPFVGPTSSKALYRAVGTLLGAGGAIFLVPPLVQSPLLLSVAIALWTGTLLFLSLNLRTANNYVLMLAGYTLPMIALAVVDNPLAVFDVASSRAQEICLGIVCAAVVGAIFWPRRLAPVVVGATGNWFTEAIRYSDTYLAREASADKVGGMRGSMVATFNSLELMIGQLGHEGAGPHTLKNARELRGRMIHLLPVIDALDDALVALEGRAPAQFAQLQPVLEAAREWLKGTADSASVARWTALHEQIDRLQPGAAALDQRAELLLSNALYRLTEWADLWQDCCTLQHALRTDDAKPWRAVYRHWRLGRLTAFFDRGLMLYSVASTVLAIVVACGLWIGLGWNDGASAVILAAVSCSFFAAMDDPAPQIYRFFFWTLMSVIFSSLYLFLVLPNLHDFPMLVLAFAVPFICIGTLTVQPRFYLGTLLTIVNTSTFISIQGAYDADFFTFLNANLAGPVGLLFAFIWTLVMRPFGVELAAKRMTRFAWRDIVEMTEPATLAEHRQVGVQMLDRLMQHLPRLSQTGQDSGVALRDLRVGLNLLDLLAYMPRAGQQARERLNTVVEEVGAHYAACLRAGERLHAPAALLRNMERARLALNLDELYERGDARTHLLHALSGLRLALLPGVEVMLEPAEQPQLPLASTERPVIGELDISGVFLPTLLVMMFGTYLVFLGVHAVLVRLHFYRLVWHRALFNVALYAVLLGAVDHFAET